MFKKLLSILVALSIIILSLSGCDNGEKTKATNSVSSTQVSSEKKLKDTNIKAQTSYQIGKDLFIDPVPVLKPGDKMDDAQIDIIIRKIFEQCNSIYPPPNNLVVEVDDSVSIEYDEGIWYKVKYIKDLDYLNLVYECVLSKKYIEENPSESISRSFIERKGILYHCKNRVGGCECNPLTPNNIDIVSKEKDKIVIKANMKSIIGKAYDIWEDADVIYTFINQDGYWVLENWTGNILAISSSMQKPSIDPSKEPPLNEYYTTAPAPEFLNEEQKNLYRRTKNIYGIFSMSTCGVEQYPLLNGKKINSENSYTEIYINGEQYFCSYGRYQNYIDFEAMILALFTKEYFHNINTGNDKYYPKFRSYNGKLFYHTGDRGSNIEHVDPDTFELISKTDDEIKCYVIGHYTEQHKDEKGEEWENRRDKGEYDRTEKYPITLVKTENGWRFSEFNITL